MDENEPPLPVNPPPVTRNSPIVDTPRNVTFSLNSVSGEDGPRELSDEFAVTGSSYYTSPSNIESASPGIPLAASPICTSSYFPGTWASGSNSSNNYPELSSSNPNPMIIEEVIASAAATKAVAQQIYRSTTPRSIGNSLDSLSECPQHEEYSTIAPQHADRSQSLGDLVVAAKEDDEICNGSFDTLMSKGLTDSGISGGLARETNDENARIYSQDSVSSPDAYSTASISFSSFDHSGFPNDSVEDRSRYSHDERKPSELPAISEESEHEQPAAMSSVTRSVDRDVIEHSYPMTHCSSAPLSMYPVNSSIAHRRVVSDDVTEMNRLKRSSEVENVDQIGQFHFDHKSSPLKSKGRCKSLMLVLQDEASTDEEEDDDVGDARDNDMLILNKANEVSGGQPKNRGGAYKYIQEKCTPVPMSTAEPPPVLISRKVSTRSTPTKFASNQSWKDKMPPFSMSGHNMYSPQSLPSRENFLRSPIDGNGTIGTCGSTSSLDVVVETTDGRLSDAAVEAELPPLSAIYRRTTSISSTATADIVHEPPTPSSPIGQQQQQQQHSFVRRSLRKIMKRGTVSASAIERVVDQYDGVGRPIGIKRRSSAAANILASAQAHLKPRTKSLKKQRIGKPTKKEKSGSDTFTFGNLFRKKNQPNRANLADIISDLDQRSSKQNLAGSIASGNRRSTSASVLPTSDAGMFESSSHDEYRDAESRLVYGGSTTK
ncbi:unnamed protein product [Caenorhabditis bovis]|uniref:Uncharacterized protein n=1 Tax=Caenorhabditis bovis TaxID=2654633 RepID=A0A8S1EVN1_9PELO|nr:unnamed protein product [Caenorhabditis bovis]